MAKNKKHYAVNPKTIEEMIEHLPHGCSILGSKELFYDIAIRIIALEEELELNDN